MIGFWLDNGDGIPFNKQVTVFAVANPVEFTFSLDVGAGDASDGKHNSRLSE